MVFCFSAPANAYTTFSTDQNGNTIETANPPQVIGDVYFRQAINTALAELDNKAPTDYIDVCKYVSSIQVGIHQNKDCYAFCNLDKIYITPLFISSRCYFSSFIAGILVHEATHAKQFYWGTIYEKTENQYEREAYGRTIGAMYTLGVPQTYINGEIRLLNEHR